LRLAGRLSAKIVQRILLGASPADCPIEQFNTLNLALNLKTAKTLDLTIPPSLLQRADQVIE
jgi:putative ABC transport system substrate-binding protein